MTKSSISGFFFAFFLIVLSSYPTTASTGSFPSANLTTVYSSPGSYPVDDPNRNIYFAAGSINYNILLSRDTKGIQIACGFYCTDGLYCSSYLFAIFINYDNGFSNVVWSANRDYPVSQDATLNFTEAGELVLRESDGSTVWSAGKSVAHVNLTDTGNLMLLDVNNSVVWQSFDHPTDCLLPGEKLFEGQKLKSSVSLADLSSQEGMYSLQVTNKGLFAYVESNPPQAYYSRLVYGNDTRIGRRYVRFFNGSLSLFVHSSEPSVPDDVISTGEALSAAQYMQLMPNGHLQVNEWQKGEWVVADLINNDVREGECSYPLVCGRNSICLNNQQCGCPKFEYFRPVTIANSTWVVLKLLLSRVILHKIKILSHLRIPSTSPLLPTWRG